MAAVFTREVGCVVVERASGIGGTAVSKGALAVECEVEQDRKRQSVT
jgi:hypothetical protein